MRLPQPAAALAQRVEAFQRTGDASALFAGDVEAETWALLDGLDENAPDDVRRLLAALFHLRFEHRLAITDLAHAVAWHWSGPAEDRPPLLRRLLPGPDAHPASQFGAAVAFAGVGDHPIAPRMAIVLLEHLVEDTSHRDHARHASLLVLLNLEIFRQGHDPRAADELLDRARACLAVLPRRHPDRGWFLGAVAVGLGIRVEAGSLGDIREAVEIGELALATPVRRARVGLRLRRYRHPFERVLDDHAAGYEPPDNREAVADHLARTYLVRFRFGSGGPDLDRALALFTAIGSAGGVARAALARFDLAGDPADLRLAADAGRDDPALAGLAGFAASPRRADPTLPAHSRGGRLRRLWLAHYEATLDPADLGAASVDPADTANLGAASADPADTADLDLLIAVGELALEVNGVTFVLDETPLAANADDPVRDRFLVRLADAHRRRFEAVGAAADIRRAADLADQIGEVADAADVSAMAEVYRLRFAESGAADDLETALALHERAFDLAGGPLITARLARAHLAAFEATGVDAHLDRAAGLAPDAPGLLRLRYARHGRAEDLDRVVARAEAAATIPSAASLVALARARTARFDALGDPADARRAVAAATEALAHDPDPRLRVARLTALAAACLRLHAVAPDEVPPLDPLIAGYAEPAPDLPALRAEAGREIGVLALALGRPEQAARVLRDAVGLLRAVVWRDSAWSEQEQALVAHRLLPGDAVAAHLAAGDPEGAVEIAERGRAIVLDAELGTRADLADLARVHPRAARRLAEVHARLTEPMLADLTGSTRDTVGSANRTRLWAERDRLVDAARELPGLAGFLRPAPVRETASEGPIVLLNAAAGRADAVVVTGDGVVHLDLPLLAAGLAEHRAALHDAVPATRPGGRAHARRVLTDLLDWLWTAAVSPVVDVVGGGRVWWLPLGPLGDLPFHAAGDALDLLVSSYLPTVRTLDHARRRPRPAVRRQLTVAVEHTAGLPRLPGTVAEAAVLHARHPDDPLLVDPTTRQVLDAVGDCTWVHFACHATVDPGTSSRAVLHLTDEVLTVEAIGRLHPEHAELAYLSACSTAARGRYVDEPLNLAAAFHLAGFRHVVAGLWPVDDALAARTATAFYDLLPDTPSADTAAHAVREVARGLRARFPGRPDVWAGLVHSGP
ncbi:CHAT domain-containing protein [Actinosynnema sp. NPDC023587]|uniref:CHAT domain-containing protein n=1 Tax=Actinosynnema sp. NPDC023587 TaxID=3154695 RepID=UPI0033EF1045